MLPASFCITESTPRRISRAKKKAANGSAANLDVEANLCLADDSTSCNESGEGDIRRRAIIEAELFGRMRLK